MKTLLCLFFLLPSLSVAAAEGFQPSTERNVVMLKGKFSGATAFFLKTPTHGEVIVTQKQVAGMNENMTIQWGNAVGLFFRLRVVDEQSFQIPFSAERLWENEEMDVAVFKAPHLLLDHCKCAGLEAASFRPGPAMLVGYPITERRIYPSTNRLLSAWREIWGNVRQQISRGSVWEEAGEYLGDMDALPGNSGGPVLDAAGKVIGVVHVLKGAQNDGYRYRNPSLSFLPIQTVLNRLKDVPPK